MKKLIERLQQDVIHIGGRIVNVDDFMNYQVDAMLTQEIGVQFAKRFQQTAINVINRVIIGQQ